MARRKGVREVGKKGGESKVCYTHVPMCQNKAHYSVLLIYMNKIKVNKNSILTTDIVHECKPKDTRKFPMIIPHQF